MDPPCLVVSETDEDKSEKDQTPLWRLAEAGDLDRVKMALAAETEVLLDQKHGCHLEMWVGFH